MYHALEKSLFNTFKANNTMLVKVSVVLLIMIQPVFVMLGALPGYLYFSTSVDTLYFWSALSFLFLFSAISAWIYNHIYEARYFSWVVLVAGKRHFYTQYCIGQAKFAISTWVMAGFGFYKSESSAYTVLMLVLLIVVHIGLYLKLADYALNKRQRSYTKRSFWVYIVLSLLKPVTFHLLMYATLFFLLAMILVFVPNLTAKLIIAVSLFTLIVLVVISISSIIKDALKRFSNFLKRVDPTLYQKIHRLVNVCIGLQILAPAALFWA